MEPDSPTMFLTIITVNATLAVALAAAASRSNRDGLFLWAIALALHTVAFALFGLRNEISDFVSIVVAATILSAAFSVFAEGLFQFQQRPPPRVLIWLPVAVIAIAFSYFLDNLQARIIISSVTYTAQIILIIVTLNQRRQMIAGRGKYFVAIGLAPVIPIFILRGFLAVTGQADLLLILASNKIQAASYLASIITTILIAIGLVVMTKERAEHRNRLVSIQDQLTGLANRRRLDEVLSKEWARAKRNKSSLALVMLDVDLFKKFNDHYGHQMGDECLKGVARVLQSVAQRENDLAARYGGEEFLLILPDTDAAAALRLAETVRGAIAALNIPHEQSHLGRITVSAGVAAMFKSSYANAESLLRATDIALYRAKQNGRNQVQAAPAPSLQAGMDVQGLDGFIHLGWDPAYECGNSIIDEQHRALLSQANNLLTASLSGKTAEELAGRIDTLMRNVIAHFQGEESIIEAAGFSGAAEHAADRQKLLCRARELMDKFHNGTLNIGELFQFMAHDMAARHFLSAGKIFSLAEAPQ